MADGMTIDVYRRIFVFFSDNFLTSILGEDVCVPKKLSLSMCIYHSLHHLLLIRCCRWKYCKCSTSNRLLEKNAGMPNLYLVRVRKMSIVHMCFSEIKVDCIRVSTIPIKTVIDDHIQRLFDALLGSLRRSVQSDITEIESFVTEALATLSQRPQTVEEIGEANVKHMEFTKRKKEVLLNFCFMPLI